LASIGLNSWIKEVTPTSHAEASFKLALALVSDCWKTTRKAVVESAEALRRERQEWLHDDDYAEGLWVKFRGMMLESIRDTEPSVEDIEENIEKDDAERDRKMRRVESFLRLMCAKIASWGLDWEKDHGDAAWNSVMRSIRFDVVEREIDWFEESLNRQESLYYDSD
jgi:hypothetical protein